jgi:hypothetical protein
MRSLEDDAQDNGSPPPYVSRSRDKYQERRLHHGRFGGLSHHGIGSSGS